MNDKTGGQAADALMGIFGFKRVEVDSMDKVIEKRRALFEAYVKIANKIDYDERGDDLFKWNGATYVTEWVSWDYQIWCAALDAVEITDPFSGQCGPYSENASSQMRAAIESTNLGLRIK